MATINDVARLAGVSRGTVSNIINGRSGVSSDKIARVNAAIESLRYVPDASARTLKTSKTNKVAVVLPNILDTNFAHIFTGVERVLNEHDYTASLYTSAEIGPKENRILDQVIQQKMDGVILATCQPEAIDRFRRLRDAGMRLVFVEREPVEKEFGFVGYNTGSSLGRILEDRIAGGCRNIGLFTGPESYSSEAECIEVWRATLARHGIELDRHFLAITNFDKESAFQAAIRLFQSANLPEVIIATSTQVLEGLLKAIEYTVFPQALEPEMISLSEASWSDHSYPHIGRIDRQAIRLGEIAAEQLLEEIENPAFSEPKRSFLKNNEAASPYLYSREAKERRTGLRVLMLNGEALDATRQLAGDFQRASGVELEIEGLEYAELWDAIYDEKARKEYDVFEIDIPWLEEFARSGYLEPLDEMIRAYPDSFSHFIPGIAETWSIVDGAHWAFPYKFGSQILFYRKDLFEDPVIKRRFYDMYKAELRPPRSWKEYNTVARFFTRSCTPESPLSWGTTLGAHDFSGAVCEFLPRKWSYENLNGPDGSLYPLDNYETLLALKNYLESFDYAPPGSADSWWNEQVDIFAAGDAAMMIMFVAHATKLANRRFSKVIGKIDFSPIPGNNPVLGGWSLGINRASARKEEAFDFLRWITRSSIAVPLTILGGASPSVDLYKSSELVGIYPWLPKALESFEISRRRTSLVLNGGRIISEHILEKLLGEAIHACAAKQISPEEALAGAERKISAFISRGAGPD
jgi:DNA-binding LacI/PurR family transcriptional regulator/ABC-type glycerol-3-phosphate transport system substrate-binding protein